MAGLRHRRAVRRHAGRRPVRRRRCSTAGGADRAMIGSRAWSAAFALLPVVGFYVSGLSITAADHLLGRPGLAAHGVLAGAAVGRSPPWCTTATRSRRSTACSTPPIASPAWSGRWWRRCCTSLLPVIHFLSVTALGFVVSGLALYAARDRLIRRPERSGAHAARLARRLGGADRRLPADAERAHAWARILIVNAGPERAVDGGAQPRHRADRHRVRADLSGFDGPRRLRAGHRRLRRGRRHAATSSPAACASAVRCRPCSWATSSWARASSWSALAVWILPPDPAAAGHDGGRAAGRASAGRSSSCP